MMCAVAWKYGGDDPQSAAPPSRQATEIGHRCLRDGLAPEAIAEVICREVPQMFALEAGDWPTVGARKVSARLDALSLMGSSHLQRRAVPVGAWATPAER